MTDNGNVYQQHRGSIPSKKRVFGKSFLTALQTQ